MAASRTPASDAELYMLLGKLDGKLDGIQTIFTAMAQRQDGHDQRLQALESDSAARSDYVRRFIAVEQDQDELETRVTTIEVTARNAKAAVIAAWAVFGSAILAIGAKVIGLL